MYNCTCMLFQWYFVGVYCSCLYRHMTSFVPHLKTMMLLFTLINIYFVYCITLIRLQFCFTSWRHDFTMSCPIIIIIVMLSLHHDIMWSWRHCVCAEWPATLAYITRVSFTLLCTAGDLWLMSCQDVMTLWHAWRHAFMRVGVSTASCYYAEHYY